MNQQLTRRSLLATAALGCVVSLSACGGGGATNSSEPVGPEGSPSAPSATGKKYRLGSTIPTFSHPFFVAMKKGLDEEAAAAGSTINVVDGKDKSQEQLNAVNNFSVEQVDALILCPTETDTLVPGVEKMNRDKIPVITVNRRIDRGDVVTYVGADDVDGGRQQGEAVKKALPNGGKIILLQGVLGSSPQRDRQKGLEEALAGDSKYSIDQKIPYEFQRRIAVDKVKTLLTNFAKGEIDAIVAQSDDGALAAADVCGREGRTEIKIIGFNGESDAFDYIKNGKIYATILQDAETQGREAVKATLRHLNGEKVETENITPLYTVTKDNISQYKPAWQSTSN
jgi:ribose transport system substrate-binding protein